jgi:hypothetical protein
MIMCVHYSLESEGHLPTRSSTIAAHGSEHEKEMATTASAPYTLTSAEKDDIHYYIQAELHVFKVWSAA